MGGARNCWAGSGDFLLYRPVREGKTVLQFRPAGEDDEYGRVEEEGKKQPRRYDGRRGVDSYRVLRLAPRLDWPHLFFSRIFFLIFLREDSAYIFWR